MNEKDRGFQGRSTPGQMGQTDTTRTSTTQTFGTGATDRDMDRDRTVGASTAYGGSTVAGATTRDSLGDNRDGLGRDRTDAVATDETGKLISADKVIGTAVYNAAGDRLGTVDSIMLNKYSGRVAYAVMSFGGFLGIGERYHPLPWDVLTYDEEKGGYNIDLTPEKLRSAPSYSRDELLHLDLGRPEQRRQLHDYYGVGGTTGTRL